MLRRICRRSEWSVLAAELVGFGEFKLGVIDVEMLARWSRVQYPNHSTCDD